MSHPTPDRRPLRVITVAILLALAAAPIGCISTDATSDRDLALDLAETRLGRPDAIAGTLRDPEAPSPDWNGRDPLDADLAVRVALSRDAGVRRTLAQVARARAELAQADRAPNPTAQLALGVSIDGLGGAPAMAAIAQQLTWLWTRPTRLEAADAALKSEIMDAAWSIVETDAAVRRAHVAARIAFERIGIDEEYAQATRNLQSLVEGLVDAGEASRIDLDRIRVEASEAAVAAEASRLAAREARIRLLARMGVPAASFEFEVVGFSAETASTVPAEERVIDLAATARLDVAASGCRVLAAEARVGLAEFRRLPEVGAGLAWNRSFTYRQGVSPGVQATIPVFDDGLPAIAAADARLHDAMLAHLQLRRRAIAAARLARTRVELDGGRRRGYEQTVLEPAVSAERLASAAYAEGVVDLTVVLLAQQRRIQAERRLLDYRLREAEARIDLNLQVGGSLELPPVIPAVPDHDARIALQNSPNTEIRR